MTWRGPARRAGEPPETEWSPFAPAGRQGAGQSRRLAWPDAVLLALAGGALIWCGWRAGNLPQYHWQWSLLRDFLIRPNDAGGWEAGLLLRGLGMTIRIGLWSMLLALCAGGLVGLLSARVRGPRALPGQIYVNLVRNTPPLVLLFLIYFFAGGVLPVTALENAVRALPEPARTLIAFGFAPPGQMDRMIAAVLTLGLYEGAYVAEIVRGGVESVPQGQWEAAAALGFSSLDRLRLIILPQAGRAILPPLAGQTISTFKDSALASLISLPDLTFQSLEIMAVSSMTFEVWISAGILYLAIGAACAGLARRLEKKSKTG